MGGRTVNVVHRAVRACVCIPDAAQCCHFFVELLGIQLSCALKHHVLQQVRYPRPGVFLLVLCPGTYPHLYRYHRKRRLPIHNNRQPILACIYLTLHVPYCSLFSRPRQVYCAS